MQFLKAIQRADAHRMKMDEAIEPVTRSIIKLLDDDGACVFYQGGDGWMILFGDSQNVAVCDVDFDALMRMNKNDALAYLGKRQI